MRDLLIRNGRIVDGTGRAAYESDLAIDGGRITAIGRTLNDKARQVIDANGAIVTPGFVDIHTHYDGQATWDDQLEPSASHGVTTVIAGNCGVGFAPVRPGGQAELVELMEGVEDIPGIALYEGIEWSWETFPQYLDLLDQKRWSMDVGTHVPHGAVRVYVMGERGVAERSVHRARHRARWPRSPRCNFSRRVGIFHVAHPRPSVDQRAAGPGTFAGEDEAVRNRRSDGRVRHGIFELVPGGSVGQGGLRSVRTRRVSTTNSNGWRARRRRHACRSRSCSSNSRKTPTLCKRVLAFVAKANADGARLFPQTAARPGGLLLGLQSNHLFQRRPTYLRSRICRSPNALRLCARRKSATRFSAENDLPPLSASINDRSISSSDSRSKTSSRWAHRSTTSRPSTRPLPCRRAAMASIRRCASTT